MSISQVNGPEASSSPFAFVERAAASAAAAPSATASVASVSAAPAPPSARASEQLRPPDASKPTDAEVSNAVKQINRVVQEAGQSIQFSIDQDSGRTVVKVVDTETNKVLRQLPSEETMAIARTLDSVKGHLINNKV